jgi:hypothetical protein
MKGTRNNDFLEGLFEEEFDTEREQEKLQEAVNKTFGNNVESVGFAKNTKSYTLYGVDKYTKNVDALDAFNKDIARTAYGYSNVFATHLAAFQFFEQFRGGADGLEVTLDVDKAFIGTLQQEAEERPCILDKYRPFVRFKQRIKVTKEDGTEVYRNVDNPNHVSLRKFLIIEKLARNNNLKMTNLAMISDFMDDEFENYLEYFSVGTYNPNKITIFGSFENINTDLKNLVIVKNNAEALAALKFKMMKDGCSLERALSETNFISLNGNDNLYKKAEDIAFFADFTNAKNILFAVKNLTLSNNMKDILKEVKELKGAELPELKEINLGNRNFVQKVRDIMEENTTREKVVEKNTKAETPQKTQKQKSPSLSIA